MDNNTPLTPEIEEWIDAINKPKFRPHLIRSCNEFYEIFGNPGAASSIEDGIKLVNSQYSRFWGSSLFNLDWTGIGPGELAFSYIWGKTVSQQTKAYDIIVGDTKIEVKKVNDKNEFYIGKDAAINSIPLWKNLLAQVPIILKIKADLLSIIPIDIDNKTKKLIRAFNKFNDDALDDEGNIAKGVSPENAFYTGEFTRKSNIEALFNIFLAANLYMSDTKAVHDEGKYQYVRFVSSNYKTKPLTKKLERPIRISDITTDVDLEFTKTDNFEKESLHDKLVVQLLKLTYAMFPHQIIQDYIESEKYLSDKLDKKFLLLTQKGAVLKEPTDLKIVKVSRNSLGVRLSSNRLSTDMYTIIFELMEKTINDHPGLVNYKIDGDVITEYTAVKESRLFRFKNFLK